MEDLAVSASLAAPRGRITLLGLVNRKPVIGLEQPQRAITGAGKMPRDTLAVNDRVAHYRKQRNLSGSS